MASKLTEFYNGGQTGVHNDFQEDFTCHLAEAFIQSHLQYTLRERLSRSNLTLNAPLKGAAMTAFS